MGVTRGQAEQAGETRETSTASVQVRVDKEEYISLRWAAAYWKARHREAVRREVDLKSDNEKLRARMRELEGRLYGGRSERRVCEGKSRSRRPVSARPRGQQLGSRGHGRSSLDRLEAREEVADLPEEQQKCPRCGRRLDPFPGTDEAQVVEIETRVWRRVIRRRRYHPSCSCGVLPGIVTAPSPARLIARGKLGISVWVRVILDKYLYSRPSHRLLQELAGQGVRLSPGTITGGLRKLLPLLEPVREAIRSKQLSEDRWQADETGWRVFEEVEGKEGHGWHLWVFRSPSTVVFTLSPSRSAQVPEAHFGDHAAGILLADRYAVYKKLARQGLNEPDEVLAATAEYRTESDVLGEWIEDRCVLHLAASAPAGGLYRDYNAWCEESGQKPLSKQWFGRRLGERGINPARTAETRSWLGIGLREEHRR